MVEVGNVVGQASCDDCIRVAAIDPLIPFLGCCQHISLHSAVDKQHYAIVELVTGNTSS